MKVICINKKCKYSELVHSGHYFRYPGRFRCSKCGSKVRPNKLGIKQIQSRWHMMNLSEGVATGRISKKQMEKALKR